jgi:hypothetical protein
MAEQRTSNRAFWIGLLTVLFLAVFITVGMYNWSDFRKEVAFDSQDNLIVRALLSNESVLGSFRFFVIFLMGTLALASLALVIKLVSSAEINLWGLGLKVETTRIEAELKVKDETIEKLEGENKTLQTMLDVLTEMVGSIPTQTQGGTNG